MPRSAEQKIKLLVLYDILQRETDEEHSLSTDALVEKLRRKLRICVERRSDQHADDIRLRLYGQIYRYLHGYDDGCGYDK